MSAKNRYNLLSRAKRNRLERERLELPSIHELDVPHELLEWNPFADVYPQRSATLRLVGELAGELCNCRSLVASTLRLVGNLRGSM